MVRKLLIDAATIALGASDVLARASRISSSSPASTRQKAARDASKDWKGKRPEVDETIHAAPSWASMRPDPTPSTAAAGLSTRRHSPPNEVPRPTTAPEPSPEAPSDRSARPVDSLWLDEDAPARPNDTVSATIPESFAPPPIVERDVGSRLRTDPEPVTPTPSTTERTRARFVRQEDDVDGSQRVRLLTRRPCHS